MSGRVILVVVAVTATAASGQQWTEVGDAPEEPTTCAQRVEGSGPVTTISGSTSTGVDDFVDAYLIEITDAAAFRATTSSDWDPNAAAVWDTRLFLFDAAGAALLANDDAPVVGGGQSYLSGPASFPGAVDPTTAALVEGTYVLMVSGWANDPEDAANVDLFDLGADFDALFGPDPGAGPFSRWENNHAQVMSGDYTIALQGVSFLPTINQCAADIDCDGAVNVVDLLALLGDWGLTDSAADIDDDGVVGVVDLLDLLAAWGPC